MMLRHFIPLATALWLALPASAATEVLYKVGQPAPGGGIVHNVGVAYLNEGSLAHTVLYVAQPPSNQIVTRLIRHDTAEASSQILLSEGDPTPSGIGTIAPLTQLGPGGLFSSAASVIPITSANGLTATYAGINGSTLGSSADETLLILGGPEGPTQLLTESQSIGSPSAFVDSFRDVPSLNANGDLACLIKLRPTLLQTPPPNPIFEEPEENPIHALAIRRLGIDATPVLAARSGETFTTSTGTTATLGTLFQPTLDDSQSVLFGSGYVSPSSFTEYTILHLHQWTPEDGLTTVLSTDQPLPGGTNRTLKKIIDYYSTPNGMIIFKAYWRQGSDDGNGLYRWENDQIEEIFATGSTHPDLPNKVLIAIGRISNVNASGSVAFAAWFGDSLDSEYPFPVLLRTGLFGPTIIDGNLPSVGTYPIRTKDIFEIHIDSQNQVTWFAEVRKDFTDCDVIYQTVDGGVTEVFSTNDQIDSIYLSYYSSLNSAGQVSIYYRYENNLKETALYTPDLHLRPFANFWDDSSSFSSGKSPTPVHRVFLEGPGDPFPSYFSGPSANTVVRALQLGGPAQPMVFMANGGYLRTTQGLTIAPNGTLSGSWHIIGTVTSAGSIAPGSANTLIDGPADLSPGSLLWQTGGSLEIQGTLVRPAHLDISAPAPAPGWHTLITHTQPPTGPTALRSAPDGFVYQIDSSQPGLLRLEVREPVTPFEIWQVTHFGSNASPASAEAADPDDDGWSNLDEFLTGSHPLNSSSFFRLSITPQASGSLRLEWPAIANGLYQIQSSTSLDGSWTPLISLHSTVDGPLYHDVNPNPSPRFFRALRLAQP